MENTNPYAFQNQPQMPVTPVPVKKPTSVTVFGVLNIVFGGLGLVCILFSFFAGLFDGSRAVSSRDIVWGLIISVGFQIWLLLIGIGLLKLRPWARRSSIAYACIYIMYLLLVIGTRIDATFHSLDQSENEWLLLIVNISVVLIFLVYPFLLLIFMQSPKVKDAFKAIGG